MKQIVIHTHKYDTPVLTRYLIRYIASSWRKAGHKVSIVKGPEALSSGDIAILHVDLTVIPKDYMALVKEYPIVINGSIKDISKRSFSSNIVGQNDGYNGPVIVKTDLNCAGKPEERKLPTLPLYSHLLSEKLGLRRRKTSSYTIYDKPEDVPPAVWHDPTIIVERFLSERKENYYCLRTWYFFGDNEMNVLCSSNEPIVKSVNIIHREDGGKVPDEMRQIRHELGFDYGKFDYAIVNGKAVLYDVNRTPCTSPYYFKANVKLLAKGIESYL